MTDVEPARPADDEPAPPAEGRNRWSYQGSSDIGGGLKGDLGYKGVLVLAALADGAAFAAVVAIVMRDQPTWQALLLVAGLTVVALALAHFAGRVLTRSPVVRLDAVRSVRAALTLAEVRELAAAADMSHISLARKWPCRYLLSWRRPLARPLSTAVSRH